MIKLITLVKRKKTLSYQEFDDYWRNHHAALVNSQKEALGILHYVQSVPLQDKNPGNAMRNSRGAPIFDFDGMAEIYWQSNEKMLSIRTSPKAKRAIQLLLDDENQFVDHSQSLIWYATERTII
ncbi:EthD domain-containing protein [Gilliamella apis]|uniref:EthD domain-containing protein n=1 Tax=Gilliamella apis TaxID=1970738 RepID=UPI000A33A83E|nr:EthD domain-containing protein [Gilliamella apis]OTQ78422.1 hypothetical protein B6D14_07105 [Gilliamella apis]